MSTVNKVLSITILLCLSAITMSTPACTASTIDLPADQSGITMTPIGELSLNDNAQRLISDVEKEGEGEFYSLYALLLNPTNLIFRSDYFVCDVNIEEVHIDWVLDLRDLYGHDPDSGEHPRIFYANLISETSKDGRFLFYWHDNKPMYVLDSADKKIYKVEIPFHYDLKAGIGSIVVLNTEDKKAYEISLDTLSVKPDPAPEVTAEYTEVHTFSPGTVINAEDVLYRGSQYFVYLGEKQEFNVVDKKSGNRLNTSRFALENANSFYSVHKDEEAVIFECDDGFYTIYKNEVKRFEDGKIAYEDIDSCTYDYVYTPDGTNVYPFKIKLNLFDVESAVRMPMELDIKNLLQER